MIKAIGQFVYFLPVRLRGIWNLTTDEKLSVTYYPERKRKSKMKIFLENIFFLLRNQEVNKYYHSYGLDLNNGVVKRDFFPLSVYKKLRTRANDYCAFHAPRSIPKLIDYNCLLDDKFLFSQYLTSLGFPTPKILAVGNKETISWFDGVGKKPFVSLLEYELDVFFKELIADCAQGNFHVKTANEKLYVNEQEFSIKKFSNQFRGRFLIQETIHQHPKLSKLNHHAINSIRLITYLRDGKPFPYLAVLKMAVGESCHDNWCSGGLAIKIDIRTGKLSEFGFFAPGKGTKTNHHPDTGAVFDDFQVPYFKEAIKMAIDLHEYFPSFHSIGWDIGITSDGPVFIEGNSEWSISIMQATHTDAKAKYLQTLPPEIVKGVSIQKYRS